MDNDGGCQPARPEPRESAVSNTSETPRGGADVYVVGTDPCSDRTLAVLPLATVLSDIDLIAALLTSRTVGELRHHAEAYEEMRGRYDRESAFAGDDDAPETLDEVPDEAKFELIRWTSEDSYYYSLPLARVRTGEQAPAEILNEFGHEDHGIGLDYEPATWIDPSDRPMVEARLRELGLTVRRDDALLSGYNYFDYSPEAEW
jgi:hypothetical protein